MHTTLDNLDSTLSCFIPTTYMEFGQGRPRTGCPMTPSVIIQNLGPEKILKGVMRVVLTFSALKKNRVLDMGGYGLVQKVFELFLNTISPHVWDSVFIQITKNKPAAQAPGPEPSQCNSTNRPNPPLQ